MKFHRVSLLAALCVYVLPPLGYADVANSATNAPVERLRQIPKDAYKGVMWPLRDRYHLRINDSIMRLAPGATIRDENNRIVRLHSVLQPQKIRYTLDMYGQVRRIWISPTGEYMGRQRPANPPEGRNDDPTDDSSEDSKDDATDNSTDDFTDDSTDDSTDTPDA